MQMKGHVTADVAALAALGLAALAALRAGDGAVAGLAYAMRRLVNALSVYLLLVFPSGHPSLLRHASRERLTAEQRAEVERRVKAWQPIPSQADQPTVGRR